MTEDWIAPRRARPRHCACFKNPPQSYDFQNTLIGFRHFGSRFTRMPYYYSRKDWWKAGICSTAPTGSGKIVHSVASLKKRARRRSSFCNREARRAEPRELPRYFVQERAAAERSATSSASIPSVPTRRILFQTYRAFCRRRSTAKRTRTGLSSMNFTNAARKWTFHRLFPRASEKRPGRMRRGSPCSAELNRENLETLLNVPPPERRRAPDFPCRFARAPSPETLQGKGNRPCAAHTQRRRNMKKRRSCSSRQRRNRERAPRRGRSVRLREARTSGPLRRAGHGDAAPHFPDDGSPRHLHDEHRGDFTHRAAGDGSHRLRARTHHGFQVRTQVSTLKLSRISLQNAIQRTGRAGRTQTGVCIRLWDEREESLFPERNHPLKCCGATSARSPFARDARQARRDFSRSARTPTAFPRGRIQRAKNACSRSGSSSGRFYVQNKFRGEAAIGIPVNSRSSPNAFFPQRGFPDLTLGTAAVLDAGPETFSKAKTAQNVISPVRSLRGRSASAFPGNPARLPALAGLPQTQRFRQTAPRFQEESTVRTFFKAFPARLRIKNGNVSPPGRNDHRAPATGNGRCGGDSRVRNSPRGFRAAKRKFMQFIHTRAQGDARGRSARHAMSFSQRSGARERFIGLAVTGERRA